MTLSETNPDDVVNFDSFIVKDNTKYIQNGNFPLSGYSASKQNLSIYNTLVSHQNKIVIPSTLRNNVLQLPHEDHQGIVRAKERLRTNVWLPNINLDTENFIKHCHSCQLVQPLQPHTPLKTTKIPDESWLIVGCDLCGPFPTGENLLVCVDYHSRLPNVETI